MAISPQRLTIYLYSANRAVIFAIAQLSCRYEDSGELNSLSNCSTAQNKLFNGQLRVTKYHGLFTLVYLFSSRFFRSVRWLISSLALRKTLLESLHRIKSFVHKKAVLSQRWPRDTRYISGSNEPLRRYGHSKLSKMAACRQLGFDVARNSAIRWWSADPENPTLEPNMIEVCRITRCSYTAIRNFPRWRPGRLKCRDAHGYPDKSG